MSEGNEEFAYAEPAPAPKKRSAWRYFATRRFLFFSILAHVLFGIFATVWIVQTIQAKRKLTFTAAPPSDNPSKRAMEHGVKMAQKRRTMSAPVQAKRIVTLASNVKVALPPMPEMPPMTNIVNPMRMAGMSPAGLGLGMSGGGGGGGGGGGDGGGDGGGGGPQAFGFRGGNRTGFTGTFYDFKQDRNGRPTDMAGVPGIQDSGSMAELQTILASPIEQRANALDLQKVSQFAAGGFNESTLSNYFKGPETLKATQIFIPTLDSRLGPAQFGLEGKVKGRRWIVIYRASVTPPVSGRYHFLGAADDYIVVRFNNQIVLDGSLSPQPTALQPVRKFPYPGLSQWVQYIREGSAVEADAQSHYDMQVMIGEKPGGYTSAFLLIDKEGEQENGVFPIFKLAKSEMEQGKPEAPPFAPDTPWSIWKAEKKDDSGDSSGFPGF